MQIIPEAIRPKMNELSRLDLELTHYDVSVQHVSHYGKWSLRFKSRKKKDNIEVN